MPIEGAPGLGYVLRKGFDLPPLMFTIDEIEAITVGARMVQRVRDLETETRGGLRGARQGDGRPAGKPARSCRRRAGLCVERRCGRGQGGRHGRRCAPPSATGASCGIAYVDEKGDRTWGRTIWPLAMAYYVDASLVGAWCELRK